MAHSAEDPEPGDRAVPRWVKGFGLVVAVLVLIAVIVMFLSGGAHGPGRHLASADVAVAWSR